METPFRSDLFSGKSVLVTGGGTGIGLSCARLMGRAGARLILASRTLETLVSAQTQLKEEAIDADVLTCDIRDLDNIAALMEGIRDRHGRLDVLINNAGGQFPSPAQHIKPKGWEAVVRNNLNGTFFITQAAANTFFIPQAAGVIVNVTANVERGFPGMAHTGAARAGVENLTKTLAVEWVHHGVRINAVAPGVIETDGIKQYPPSMVAEFRGHIPMKRLGSAEEVANLITFLASDAASYITGETVYIDGGARLWGSPWPIPDPASET